MAKGDKEQMKNKLASMGDKLASTEPKFVVQKTVEEDKTAQQQEIINERGFHLFMPDDIYWAVKKTCIEDSEKSPNKISMKDYINTLLKNEMIKRGKIKAE